MSLPKVWGYSWMKNAPSHLERLQPWCFIPLISLAASSTERSTRTLATYIFTESTFIILIATKAPHVSNLSLTLQFPQAYFQEYKNSFFSSVVPLLIKPRAPVLTVLSLTSSPYRHYTLNFLLVTRCYINIPLIFY